MSKQIVFIGAGVIGLCAAHYAARRGHRVLLLDQGAPEDTGCSYGNAGMIVPSHFIPLAAPGVFKQALKWMWNPESPLYVKPSPSPALLAWAWRFWRASSQSRVDRAAPALRDLSLASLACFEELAAMPELEVGLVRNGLLMLCKTHEALDEEAETVAMAGRLGIPARLLSADETAAMEPGIPLDIVGAVHFPKDCHLPPEHFLRSLRTHLEAMNAEFRWRTEALDFETQRGVIRKVRTNRGVIEADEFVICGGAWSTNLGRALGLRLPIQAGKGYSLTLPNPPGLPRICSILAEARVAVTPMDNALRVAGTMEIGGQHDTVNPRRVRGILKALPQYYPAFEAKAFEGIRPWMGRRPVSPDGLPYLGRPTGWANVVVATGHAMMGLSLGPVSGRLVAELIDDETPSVDLSLFKPDRYS